MYRKPWINFSLITIKLNTKTIEIFYCSLARKAKNFKNSILNLKMLIVAFENKMSIVAFEKNVNCCVWK